MGRGMMKARLLRSAVSAALLGLLSGSIGSASSASAQSADQQTSITATGLEEVVVTARRREEKIQTVPLAITAFSQKDLEVHRIAQVEDLARSVPSLGV